LLVGGGSFFDLLEPERIQLATESLYLQGSKFGWVVTGEVGVSCLSASRSIGEGLEEDWRAAMSGEEMFGRSSKANKKCIEEQEALKHFKSTAKRDRTGRFVLRLSLKSNVHKIGKTLEMATARFLSVERRLQRDPELRRQYIQFMDEYLKMGHMKKVMKEDKHPEAAFYLSHHSILKLSSLTTK